MPTVVFHHPDTPPDVVEADAGTSLMRAAVQRGVRGIVGECGGQAMCATCHVYVHPEYLESLEPIGEDEDEMLEDTAAPRLDNSRLGCQVPLDDALPEIHVDVPQTQV
ncbi:MAG TPA: 2Fe-2S iron-sulfur cluster-binding protein [Blastococcus sp.]|jgi:ferredoxin, 2Fe-2S|nr:2Fe-2S iron-sulfur cluster-binding protein [Blastococcus sp.]